MATPRNYWMVSIPSAYADVCREQGFTLLGMGKAHRKRAQRMEVGDRVLFYVSDALVFAATASVSSTYFEDETPTWPSSDPEERFAWRVKLKPDVILDDAHLIDARLLAPRMEYVKKWAPELWYLAFQGLLHLVPKVDFSVVEREMRRGVQRPQVRLGEGIAEGAHCILDLMAAEA